MSSRSSRPTSEGSHLGNTETPVEKPHSWENTRKETHRDLIEVGMSPKMQ